MKIDNIINFPLDEGSVLGGCENAPRVISATLARSISAMRKYGYKSLIPYPPKDIFKRKTPPLLADVKSYRKYLSPYICTKKSPIFIGGNHTITYHILDAMKENDEDIVLVCIDAHTDLYRSKSLSNACVMHHIRKKLSIPIVHLGARKGLELFTKQRDMYLSGYEVQRQNSVHSVERLLRRFENANIYMSIDIDILDPVFAPAVNFPVCGGFSSADLFNLVRDIMRICKKIRAIDICEYNPSYERHLSYPTAVIIAELINIICANDVLPRA